MRDYEYLPNPNYTMWLCSWEVRDSESRSNVSLLLYVQVSVYLPGHRVAIRSHHLLGLELGSIISLKPID